MEDDFKIVGKVCHNEKKIYINPADSPQRQRFTIAHEIGHIVLHKDTNDVHHRMKDVEDKDLNIYSDNIQEIEANRFAAMLLMPELEFKKAWSRYSNFLDSIAEYFNVSKLAAGIRANNLGLLSL